MKINYIINKLGYGFKVEENQINYTLLLLGGCVLFSSYDQFLDYWKIKTGLSSIQELKGLESVVSLKNNKEWIIKEYDKISYKEINDIENFLINYFK